jgi:hypothetical protein
MNTAEILEKSLCATFCESITVNSVPCGFAVSSAFTDASGDRIGFYVIAEGENYRLEDDGEYLSRLIAQDIDVEKGQRYQLLESILQTASAFWDRDTYEIKTASFDAKKLMDYIVGFLSALIRIRDLELLTRDFVRSTFREDATAAISERFGQVANINEREPVAKEFSDYLPDLVIRPKNNGLQTAVFLASNTVSFQEAELLHAEIEKESRKGDIAVIALIEDTEKIQSTISLRRFQRAQNRGLIMPIFRGDESAALAYIARNAGLAV